MNARRRWGAKRAVEVTIYGLAAGFLFTVPVAAADAPPAALAASCGGCHTPSAGGAIPALEKLDAATMAAKLAAFRAGTAEATIMSRIAKGYTEPEIAALVQYLAGGRR
jgi:cytochrome c553